MAGETGLYTSGTLCRVRRSKPHGNWFDDRCGSTGTRRWGLGGTRQFIPGDLDLWRREDHVGHNADTHHEKQDAKHGTGDFVKLKRIHSAAPKPSRQVKPIWPIPDALFYNLSINRFAAQLATRISNF